MKLVSNAEVMILAIEKKEATKDFNESYKMAIMQGSEVGTFPCTKDVYMVVPSENLMRRHVIQITSSEYQGKVTQRITSVSAPIDKNVSAPIDKK